MPYSVTSDFVDNAYLKTSAPIRKFTIGTSDYSSAVIKWPKISKTWDNPKPATATIELNNADGGMNFLRIDKTLLTSQCTVEIGFGSEFIAPVTGKIDVVKYKKGKCSIRIIDKMKQLSERLVGSNDVPVNYISDYPSNIAWWAVTSFGGFDLTTTTANTDIDWNSWFAWNQLYIDDNIKVGAEFKGLKVTEILRKIARITNSAIYIENNKLVFSRFTITDAPSLEINDTVLFDSTLSVADNTIINKQVVEAGYSVASDYFTITVEDELTSSINSYGLREETEEDSSIWYTTSLAALNLAQRILFTNGEPLDSIQVTTPLVGMIQQIGDTITYINNQDEINDSYKVMERSFDVNLGRVSLTLDRSNIVNPFILDVTSLDGTEVLT